MIKTLPIYSPGDIVDLSYKITGLPDRVSIEMVYFTKLENEWIYSVIIESTGNRTTVLESELKQRSVNKTSKVYKHQHIVQRYTDGWRFCGNYNQEEALKIAKSISNNDIIKHVRIYNGIAPNGSYKDGLFGVWIKYNNIISNVGQLSFNADNIIIIK